MKKTDALKLIVKETGIIERRIKRLEDKIVTQHETLEGIEKLTVGLMQDEITVMDVVDYFRKPEVDETLKKEPTENHIEE